MLLRHGLLSRTIGRAAIGQGHIRDYRAIFRDLTRWSLLGVILTELTVNAHAYLVTFISGPGPFALLAVGQILMRPATLVQSALPDVERPAMTRAIAARDESRIAQLLRDFRLMLVMMWLGTVALAAAILEWAPHLLLKKIYAPPRCAAGDPDYRDHNMLVRSFRAPPATFHGAGSG